MTIAPPATPVPPCSREAEILRWKRRTGRVAFARKALPLSILAIVLFIAGWVIARSVVPSLVKLPVEFVGAIRMVNPRFYGRDSKDRAFLVGAKEAVRDIRDKGLITLTDPVFSLGAGRVTAKQGLYRDGQTDLILRGDVVFIDPQGGRMESQEAKINTKTGTITNTDAAANGVQIDAGFGQLKADSYTIDKDGKAVFRGRVHAQFKQR